jgi:hypothetical protein
MKDGPRDAGKAGQQAGKRNAQRGMETHESRVRNQQAVGDA